MDEPAKNWCATSTFLASGSIPDAVSTASMASPYPWTSTSSLERTSETLK